MSEFIVNSLILFSLASLLNSCSSEANNGNFRGTELTAKEPAAPFRLTNEMGQVVSLSDYHGRVLVVTFLYTSCTDICPSITQDLHKTRTLLGDISKDVDFLAISVDPEHDSIDNALQYSNRWDMTDKWDFLVGDRSALSRLWQSYYIDPLPSRGRESKKLNQIHSTSSTSANSVDDLRIESGLIAHSSPVFLIDSSRLKRVLFTSPVAPKDLAHDIKALAKNRKTR